MKSVQDVLIVSSVTPFDLVLGNLLCTLGVEEAPDYQWDLFEGG